MSDQPGNKELLAAVDGSAYPLSDEECVFRTRADGDKHVMTLDVLRAMDACSRFQTFDEHVRSVTSSQGQLQGQDLAVRQVLDSAYRKGLMVSAREMLAAPGTEQPDGSGAPVPVFVRAGGDGPRLDALLQSASRIESETGRRHRYFVVGVGTGACRDAVEGAAERGLDCSLLDADWQRGMVKESMHAAGLEDDPALKAALLGDGDNDHAPGRLRNIVLLASAGARHLMLDHDQVLRALRDSGASSGIELDSRAWSYWFFPDAAGADAWGREAEVDPVMSHFRALGLTGRQAVRQVAHGPDALAGVDNRQIERMAPGAVLATQSGDYGDSGEISNLGHYLARGESLDRFHPNPEDYRRYRESRYLARVRGSHAFQSQTERGPVGIANDRMHPPTLAEGLGEAVFYGAALAALYPRGRVLEFPWALGRFPVDGQGPELAWQTPFTGSLGRFLATVPAGLSSRVPEVTDDARFRLLAERLRALGALGDEALLDRVAAFHVSQRVGWIQRLHQGRGLAKGRYPEWEKDVRAIMQVNGESLERGVPRRLADMPDSLGDEDAARWLRDRVLAQARLLEAWPALWRAAASRPALAGLARSGS